MVAKDEDGEESKFQSMKCPSVSGKEFVLRTLRKLGSHWRTLIRGEISPFRFRFLRLLKDPLGIVYKIDDKEKSIIFFLPHYIIKYTPITS